MDVHFLFRMAIFPIYLKLLIHHTDLNNHNCHDNHLSTVMETLQAASQNLLFVSESEYPFEVFVWELPTATEINAETVIAQIGAATDTPVEFTDLESFFAVATTLQDWHGSGESEMVDRFQNLVRSLQENLQDIQVVRVGDINIDVYIVGKTTEGYWVGLKTQVVET